MSFHTLDATTSGNMRTKTERLKHSPSPTADNLQFYEWASTFCKIVTNRRCGIQFDSILFYYISQRHGSTVERSAQENLQIHWSVSRLSEDVFKLQKFPESFWGYWLILDVVVSCNPVTTSQYPVGVWTVFWQSANIPSACKRWTGAQLCVLPILFNLFVVITARISSHQTLKAQAW